MVQANNIIQDNSYTNQDGDRADVISITVITGVLLFRRLSIAPLI